MSEDRRTAVVRAIRFITTQGFPIVPLAVVLAVLVAPVLALVGCSSSGGSRTAAEPDETAQVTVSPPERATRAAKEESVPSIDLLTVDDTPLVAPDAKRGGSLNLTASRDFKGFNRLLENSVDVSTLYTTLVGNRLARRHFAAQDKWHGDLSDRIVANEDFTTYHVSLRTGVKWHRPSVDYSDPSYKWLDKDREVTSDDFKFMLEMVLDERVTAAAPLRSYFKDFDRIEILGPHAFKIHWKR